MTIRVLVVEDSLSVRMHLVEVLENDPGFEVIGQASDGRRAIELCEKLRPDVVTMDMVLPLMSGLAATEYIMAFCPTPIVIVSSSMNRGEVFHTYDAIAAGAVEAIPKPKADKLEQWSVRFRSVLRIASRIKVVTHLRGRLSTRKGKPFMTAPPVSRRGIEFVAVGASTGGPAAIRRLLLDLPPSAPVTTLLVLHIGEPFDATFADWLDAQTPHRVTFAVDGESLEGAPRVIMAPAAKHMCVENQKIRLTNGPERHSCRPSVDVLFESIARELGPRAMGVLLTGMGRDGAEGLLAMRQNGSQTIAQDEASSVIWGMPRSAIELGAAEKVVALDSIADTIVDLIEASRVKR